MGGLKHPELATLVKTDRAAAEKLSVLDRLLTPEFRAQRPDLAFLFRQMGTFNTAKMADLRNLGSDGPTLAELAAAPFPVLLLAGEKDSVLSPSTVRRAGELLPRARVEIVPGAPHLDVLGDTRTVQRRSRPVPGRGHRRSGHARLTPPGALADRRRRTRYRRPGLPSRPAGAWHLDRKSEDLPCARPRC